MVIRGSKPGPVLALVSGLHGTEYLSIIALEKVIQMLDPAQVSGTVIILPLVNIASFEQKVPHVNPVDGKSMNRFYPGKQDGTQTERVSYAITKQVVERCDYLVDYHGGDIDENLRPYSYWPKSGDAKQDAITRDMVLAFGLDHIWVKNGQEALGYLSGLGQYDDRIRYPLPALILLDLDLPEMTGFELPQWKRTQPYIRRIPVVVLTIDSATSAVNAAYDLGANSYLVKPGNPEEILRVVKSIQEYWLGLNEAPKLALRATPDAR
ncbi:MAG: succinylglutamate desuccinylase/aspartoacylase family protein [Candidatus Angelobacter sp.]